MKGNDDKKNCRPFSFRLSFFLLVLNCCWCEKLDMAMAMAKFAQRRTEKKQTDRQVLSIFFFFFFFFFLFFLVSFISFLFLRYIIFHVSLSLCLLFLFIFFPVACLYQQPSPVKSGQVRSNLVKSSQINNGLGLKT